MIKAVLIVIMLNIWLFGQVPDQVPKSEYKIANVYILLDADTRYLRKLANRTISRDRINHSAEIACFERHLLMSGLFDNVNYRISKLVGTDRYDLTLITKYKKNPPVYEIEKVTFTGFSNLHAAKLGNLSRSVLSGTHKVDLRYDFPRLEKTLIDGLGKLANTPDFYAWVELALNSNKLVVTVSPQFAGCSESESESLRTKPVPDGP